MIRILYQPRITLQCNAMLINSLQFVILTSNVSYLSVFTLDHIDVLSKMPYLVNPCHPMQESYQYMRHLLYRYSAPSPSFPPLPLPLQEKKKEKKGSQSNMYDGILQSYVSPRSAPHHTSPPTKEKNQRFTSNHSSFPPQNPSRP